jgi:hypothetical protein
VVLSPLVVGSRISFQVGEDAQDRHVGAVGVRSRRLGKEGWLAARTRALEEGEMDRRIGLPAAVVCALLVVASSAAARTDGHGHGYGHRHRHRDGGGLHHGPRHHGHGHRAAPTPNPEFAQFFCTAYPDPLTRAMLFSFEQDLWDHGETDGYAEHITSKPLPDTPRHSILMTVGFGDHQVTNWASEIEARTIGAQLRTPALDPGRYPGPFPYWGIAPIPSFPFIGSAAMVIGDLGPLRSCPNDGVTVCAGNQAGTRRHRSRT